MSLFQEGGVKSVLQPLRRWTSSVLKVRRCCLGNALDDVGVDNVVDAVCCAV